MVPPFSPIRSPAPFSEPTPMRRSRRKQQQDLRTGLVEAGFRLDRAAFFHWLGVVPYLPREIIASTLAFIAGVPGSEVVFDYSEPLENYPEERRAYLAGVAARNAALGEPWITHFNPAEISTELRAHGFHELEDLRVAEIVARYLGGAVQQAENGPGPHVIRARRADR
jgi:O-methyltransferase involved in polyketide biosynthesis